MSAKYTPGPWKHDVNWGLVKHGKTEICALHSGNPANARLIAAAPEMLQALQCVVDLLGDQEGIFIEQCKAALAKAKGGE